MSTDRFASLYDKAARRGQARIGDTRECKLCGFPAHPFTNMDFNQSCGFPTHVFTNMDFTQSCDRVPLVRSNILVEYFRCQRCELLFTDFFDDWSNEDFGKFIYNDEYIVVDGDYAGARAARTAEDLSATLKGLEQLRILDFGSGSGHFETEMKQRGFAQVASFDPFSHPTAPTGQFDLITCFDVVEHSPKPKETFRTLLSLLAPDGCLLVGQTLQPPDIADLRDRWWYLGPRNGHCTTYSPETLDVFARATGLLFFDFGNLFALTRAQPSAASRTIVERRMPQRRRLELFAPAPDDGIFLAWQGAEPSPSGAYRWTREARIPFGMHETSRGSFRVTFRHFGQRSDEFLRACRISVGEVSAPIAVHEEDVFAVVDLPFPAHREITLLTPPPLSDLTLGLGSDPRPLGLAIACRGPADRAGPQSAG